MPDHRSMSSDDSSGPLSVYSSKTSLPTAASPKTNDDTQAKHNSDKPLLFSPSSTNNLLEDREDHPTTRGADDERVAELTDYVFETSASAYGYGGFSDVLGGVLRMPVSVDLFEDRITIYKHDGDDEKGLCEQPVAIKCPRFQGSSGCQDEGMKNKIKKRVAKELFTSSKLRHSNIIEVLGFARIERYEFNALVMEWCPGGTLYWRLTKSPKLSEIEQSTMLLQLAAGLEYIHSKDIVHADIKPDNVLIGPEGQIKISDFGLSRIIQNIDPSTNSAYAGAEPYMSPELCSGEGGAKTLFSDVWAFGVVAYQLLEHDVTLRPYSHVAGMSGKVIAKQEGSPPYPNGQQSSELTKYFMSIISPCWALDPHDRDKMSHILLRLHECFLKQDLCDPHWDWLFASKLGARPTTSIIGGVNIHDLVRDSVAKYNRGAYSESRVLRAKAAIAELFRGNLLECAKLQRELANSCAAQYDREATLRHYNSAIRKYESLGPLHAEAADECRKLQKEALDVRQFGLWSDLADLSQMIRRAGGLGEQALDQGDFVAAAKHFEELLDIARRDGNKRIMAQACVRLAWACELESQLKLRKAKEHYLVALEHAKEDSMAFDQKTIEQDLKRLEGIQVSNS